MSSAWIKGRSTRDIAGQKKAVEKSRNVKQVNFAMDGDLYAKFKAKAAANNEPAKKLLEKAVRDYVNNN